MRYERPIVVELGARAGRAQGQNPLACISGASAGGGGESCGVGEAAGYTCAIGTAGPAGDLCLGGGSPGGGWEDCFSGEAAFFCGVGSGGGSDPEGCRNGPSFV